MAIEKIIDTLTENQITEKILTLVEEHMGIAQSNVSVQKSFSSYGLDSIDALTIVGDLEEWLEITLPSTLLWDCETISQVTDFIYQEVSNH